jgi:hypothetical protein
MSPCSGSNIRHMTGRPIAEEAEFSQGRCKGRTNECGWGIDRIWGYERNGAHASRDRFRHTMGPYSWSAVIRNLKHQERDICNFRCMHTRLLWHGQNAMKPFVIKSLLSMATAAPSKPSWSNPFLCISKRTKIHSSHTDPESRTKKTTSRTPRVVRHTFITPDGHPFVIGMPKQNIPYRVSISLAPRN